MLLVITRRLPVDALAAVPCSCRGEQRFFPIWNHRVGEVMQFRLLIITRMPSAACLTAALCCICVLVWHGMNYLPHEKPSRAANTAGCRTLYRSLPSAPPCGLALRPAPTEPPLGDKARRPVSACGAAVLFCRPRCGCTIRCHRMMRPADGGLLTMTPADRGVLEKDTRIASPH